MNEIGIIIQARMGSTRLPGKVMKLIAGMPLLEHVIKRLEGLNSNVEIVIATSLESQDDVIQHYCRDNDINCFRGDEEDVLSRYYEAAKKYNFKHIVRLTADNPFTDIEELDRLIRLHVNDSNDYTHSFGDLPIGVGAEIFSFDALGKSHFEGYEYHHREHVNEYIQERPNIFKIKKLDITKNKICSELRLTVDTEDDYRNACFIAEKTSGRLVTTEEVIKICLHFA